MDRDTSSYFQPPLILEHFRVSGIYRMINVPDVHINNVISFLPETSDQDITAIRIDLCFDVRVLSINVIDA